MTVPAELPISGSLTSTSRAPARPAMQADARRVIARREAMADKHESCGEHHSAQRAGPPAALGVSGLFIADAQLAFMPAALAFDPAHPHSLPANHPDLDRWLWPKSTPPQSVPTASPPRTS